MKPGMGDGGSCHPRDNIALRWLAKDLNLGYDIFGNVMLSREKQAENMAREILKHGKNIYFSSDTYKPGTDLLNGSYSVLVQHFVMEQGGNVVSGLTGEKADVIVRVHQDDKIESDGTTIIFDPWRSYPSADNVVHYGKDSKIFMSGK
jgi:UDPglucose 6-dehydrogenase